METTHGPSGLKSFSSEASQQLPVLYEIAPKSTDQLRIQYVAKDGPESLSSPFKWGYMCVYHLAT